MIFVPDTVPMSQIRNVPPELTVTVVAVVQMNVVLPIKNVVLIIPVMTRSIMNVKLINVSSGVVAGV